MPKLNSALGQIYVVGFICFCCPGMFNALNGLGGAGQVDATTANNSNVALYACFAISGLFAGAAFNIFGPRILMATGGITYSIYAICQYAAGQDSKYNGLAIFSGALLGVGAGFIWTAQGALMLSYPTEQRKGAFISIFWVIFNLGGMMGGLLAFGLNYDNPNGDANPATYFSFCAIMACGSILALFLLKKPSEVVKEDNTMVVFHQQHGPVEELKSIAYLFLNKHMVLLIPLFITSNWFYTYQFTAVNGYLFTARTRGLNSALYWGSQMFAAFAIGKFLDSNSLGRRKRAVIGLIAITTIVTLSWILGYVLQRNYERGEEPKSDSYKQNSIDFTSSNYGFPFFVYLLYGFSDAIIQCYAYWIMGSLTNDVAVASRYTGFYKGIQSSGGAISWRIDTLNTSFMTQLAINWALFSVSVPFTALVTKDIKDTSDDSGNEALSPVDKDEVRKDVESGKYQLA